MTTVLDIAAHAELPVETVLRVLLRQPTNETARRRVAQAVSELGLPDYPRPGDHIEVLPAVPETQQDASNGSHALASPIRENELADELCGVIRELVERFERERRNRVNDLDLSTNLLTESWRNVDRRLGRLEKMIERLDRHEFLERTSRGSAEIHRLDDVRHPGT
jgi:hypothetical protein